MDSPELRQLLTETWSHSAGDAIARGVSERAVADTMLGVALGLLQRTLGDRETAAHLSAVAEQVAARAPVDG